MSAENRLLICLSNKSYTALLFQYRIFAIFTNKKPKKSLNDDLMSFNSDQIYDDEYDIKQTKNLEIGMIFA